MVGVIIYIDRGKYIEKNFVWANNYLPSPSYTSIYDYDYNYKYLMISTKNLSAYILRKLIEEIMKDITRVRNMNGSWYALISPSYARHLKLEGEHGTTIEMEIQDEEGSLGKYVSFWKKGE